MTKIFPNNIAEIRKKKGISQKEFAEMLNLSVWHLNKIENHSKPITTTTAMKVAKELDVTLNDIFLQ